MERTDADKIKGIVVCVVIPPVFANLATAKITGKGFESVHRERGFDTGGSNHVWLEYLELQPGKQYWNREEEGEASDLRISFTTYGYRAEKRVILEKFGAYLIRNTEERA
ncbi:hypothetical protein CJ030_MR0G027292 [Morella rubra]|uniref:Uncharacterized protein n=1 Tax=Morella rubra TaxID=262757 RepID=A0A6A1UEE9_9ROSI|nr:hypothetical protein CJ030_MR0G027292 [Morella rubra]